MSARTTENRVGCLLRSSSGNHSPETRTVPATVCPSASRASIASQSPSAAATAGMRTSPRSLQARTSNPRCRPVNVSAGSQNPMSQRV